MRRLCANPETNVKYGKLFRHEKSYKDHLGSHDGIKRFKCRNEKFLRESQLINTEKIVNAFIKYSYSIVRVQAIIPTV